MEDRVAAFRSHARRGAELAWGADGKVALIYDSEENALSASSASIQPQIDGSEIGLHRAVRDAVAGELREAHSQFPGFERTCQSSSTSTAHGTSKLADRKCDDGLSGKKLAVDSYSPDSHRRGRAQR